jgi:hypothetical protein
MTIWHSSSNYNRNRNFVNNAYVDIEEIHRLQHASKFKLSHYQDLMKTIDWNERLYQEDAKAFLKRHSILSVAA